SRWATLAHDAWVSQEANDRAISAAGEAAANVKLEQAALEAAAINLKYTKMLSPISGRIGRSTVTPGALVTANQTSAFATVTQLDPIYVDVNQPVTTLLRFRQELAVGEIERADNG